MSPQLAVLMPYIVVFLALAALAWLKSMFA